MVSSVILVWIMRVLSFGGIYWVSWLQSSLQSSHMRQQNFSDIVQNWRLWDWNMIGICNFVDLSCLSIITIIISTLQVVWWSSNFLLAGASLHVSHIVYFESSWDCCGCCQKHLVIIQRRICGHFASDMPCGFLCSVSVPILQSTLQIVWGFYALSKDVQSIANVGCLLSSDYWITIPKSWSKVSKERTI